MRVNEHMFLSIKRAAKKLGHLSVSGEAAWQHHITFASTWPKHMAVLFLAHTVSIIHESQDVPVNNHRQSCCFSLMVIINCQDGNQ